MAAVWRGGGADSSPEGSFLDWGRIQPVNFSEARDLGNGPATCSAKTPGREEVKTTQAEDDYS